MLVLHQEKWDFGEENVSTEIGITLEHFQICLWVLIIYCSNGREDLFPKIGKTIGIRELAFWFDRYCIYGIFVLLLSKLSCVPFSWSVAAGNSRYFQWLFWSYAMTTDKTYSCNLFLQPSRCTKALWTLEQGNWCRQHAQATAEGLQEQEALIVKSAGKQW